MTYAQFKTVPDYTQATWENGKVVSGVGPMWSGKKEPPKIGETIRIRFNQLGTATVTGYFIENEWLGVLCTLHHPPAWHEKQNKGDRIAHIFGAEISGQE
jgi:hypothetical protein